MATTAARPRRKVRTDDILFSGTGVVSLIAVLVGFARTYFLAGAFRAPVPNLLIHVHGAVFTLWIILFVSQTRPHRHQAAGSAPRRCQQGLKLPRTRRRQMFD